MQLCFLKPVKIYAQKALQTPAVGQALEKILYF